MGDEGRPGPSNLLLPRVIGALLLRARTFDEVARDPRAGLQAGLLIVVIGVLESSVHAAKYHAHGVDVADVVQWVMAGLLGWLIWSAVVWVIGARSFGHDTPFADTLRGVAFAHAPGLFYGIGVFPVVVYWSGLLRAATLLWFGAALWAAIRGIFHVSPMRTTQILVLSVLVQVFLHEVAPHAFRLIPGLNP